MKYLERDDAILVLEDGTYYTGKSIGTAANEGRFAEVVFNTSMSGYQEIISDPSYKGQMVCFTYPSIGNYGANHEDNESTHPHLEAIIVKDYCENPSNFRSNSTLEEYLVKNKVSGITGIDTRKLAMHIREAGSMRAALYTTKIENAAQFALEKATEIKKHPDMNGLDLAGAFTGIEANEYVSKTVKEMGKSPDSMKKIAVLDFGIKYSILMNFLQNDIFPEVFPGGVDLKEQKDFNPGSFSGFFLSNGPGDPAAVKTGIENIKYLLGLKKPTFGICLGHQMLSLALGAKTFKMKFGHHGGNLPVKTVSKPRVLITAQNHGFAADEGSLKKLFEGRKNSTIDINPNDQSIEGFTLSDEGLKIISVQFHPEAAPGPNDARVLFKEFSELL